ncbi:MAG: proteasome beta-type subunit, partial [Actinomycetota bacterium]
GSGGMHAGTVVKVGWKSDLTMKAAIELAARSLWEAADADSATGGPDALRGVYPIVATIDQSGWSQVGDDTLRDIYTAIAEEVRTR